MNYLELDAEISEEARSMQEMAGKFGREVMRPAGIELDKLDDPQDVIAEDSILWDVFKKYRELGFHKTLMPGAVGGMQEEMAPGASALLNEELGYADCGLAISLGVSNMPFYLASLFPEPELQKLARDYVEDTEARMIGCWAITEPDHGSDWLMGSLPEMRRAECAPSLKAVIKGGEYILNGTKAAWVSNGTIATHASLHVSLDSSMGMHGTGLAIIPLDLPGITRSKPLNKMGQRPLNQGEIYFDDVRIPKKYMVITDPEVMTVIGKLILGGANSFMSLIFSGLAQAAFDLALKYSKERIQGGVPIINHQNIKLKIFEMFRMTEAARSFARRTANYNRIKNPEISVVHSIAAKILSTESAFKVASEAIQVFGGYGLTKEYPVEKIFRDARASMIEDGVNETLAIIASGEL